MSGGPAGGPGTRAQPFMCPYCGEEDLRPAEPPASHHCPSCDRRFALRFLGLGEGEAGDGGVRSGGPG